MANKTQPTIQSVDAFLETVQPTRRKVDAQTLIEIFDQATGLPARMWSNSIIGYGRYHYTYASGRSGDFLMTGFSPRKSALSIYIMPGYRDLGDKLDRLGKHKTGKSCLYVNKLADIECSVLAEIITDGIDYMRANYETFDE